MSHQRHQASWVLPCSAKVTRLLYSASAGLVTELRIRLEALRLQRLLPQHRVTLAVNGATVETVEFDGLGVASGEVEVKAPLVDGLNRFTVTAVDRGQDDSVYVDFLELDFARRFLAIGDGGLHIADPATS